MQNIAFSNMFWFFGFCALFSPVLSLDCEVVSLPGVVPRVVDQTPPSTSVDFSSVFTMLAHLTRLYSIFELTPRPENNKTISTDRLAHCLILGTPVPWENLQMKSRFCGMNFGKLKTSIRIWYNNQTEKLGQFERWKK